MIVRLFSATEIKDIGQIVVIDEKQTHYLTNVLRLGLNSRFFVFDGVNGEFELEICEVHKKSLSAVVCAKSAEFSLSPDVWLLFAPLKKDKTDFVIQKSTELGVRKIMPVLTEYTNCDKVRTDRLVMQCIEASEQCRRTDVPEVMDTKKLFEVLDNWDTSRTLFFLDEKGKGGKIEDVMKSASKKVAILVGPEGGFSEREAQMIAKLPFVKAISLGSRILRAETAALASLACWQAIRGDW